MSDTDLDQHIRDDLRRLVAEAPLPPLVTEITSPTATLSTGTSRPRPVLVAVAAAIVLLAVAGAVVLRQQSDESDVSAPKTPSGLPTPPPGAGPLPRLIPDDPAWQREQGFWQDSPSVPFNSDHRLAVYRSEDGWRPTLLISTATGNGNGYRVADDRVIDIEGHSAHLSPRYASSQALDWIDGREAVSLTGFDLPEADLIALARTVVRAELGMYVLPSPPPGMVEAFRTEALRTETGRSAEWSFHTDTARVSLYASGGGADAYWDAVTDVLFAIEDAEPLTIRGVEGLLTSDGHGFYRIDWLEREGTVAMRMDVGGAIDRAELDAILDSLVEVDETTWQALLAAPGVPPLTAPLSETPSTTTSPLAAGESCPDGAVPIDVDLDGVDDACAPEGLESPG